MSDDEARLGAGGTGGSAEGAGRPPPSAWRRLLWWILPVGYWLVASRVPLPGVDLVAFRMEVPWVAGLGLSLLTAGLWPLVAGYVLVEIGAALVPAWRPLRHTRRGRGALARAAFLGAMIATLFAAWRTLSLLSENGALVGSPFLPVVTMLGATALLWIVLHVSDSRSSGSALALLLGLSSAFVLVRDGIGWSLIAGPKDLPQPHTPILLSSLSIVATVLVLRARAPGGRAAAAAVEAPGGGGLFVRLPVGGLVPLLGVEIVVSALVFAVTSRVLPFSIDPFGASWPLRAALIGLGVVASIEGAYSWPSSSVVWGALFDGHGAVPDGAGRSPAALAPPPLSGLRPPSGGPRGAPYEEGAPPTGNAEDAAADEDGAEVEGAIGAAYAPPRDAIADRHLAIEDGRKPGEGGDGAALRERRIRSQLVRAAVPTIVYLVLVSWPMWPIVDLPAGTSRTIGAMAGVCLLVAVLMDLVAETRFRRAHRDAVSVVVQLHTGAADAVIAALAEASVPAFARNMNVRVLTGFFGPFAPIEVLVPSSRLAAARERLAAILVAEPEIEAPRGEDPGSVSGDSGAPPERRVVKRRRKRPAAEEAP